MLLFFLIQENEYYLFINIWILCSKEFPTNFFRNMNEQKNDIQLYKFVSFLQKAKFSCEVFFPILLQWLKYLHVICIFLVWRIWFRLAKRDSICKEENSNRIVQRKSNMISLLSHLCEREEEKTWELFSFECVSILPMGMTSILLFKMKACEKNWIFMFSTLFVPSTHHFSGSVYRSFIKFYVAGLFSFWLFFGGCRFCYVPHAGFNLSDMLRAQRYLRCVCVCVCHIKIHKFSLKDPSTKFIV